MTATPEISRRVKFAVARPPADSSCIGHFERALAFDQFRHQRVGGESFALPHFQKIDEGGAGGGAGAQLDAGIADALDTFAVRGPRPRRSSRRG